MNILQILPELHVGGVETGTVDLAKYLTKSGHKAVVVSHGGALVEELERHGIKHYTLPVHKKNLWTMFHCFKKLIAIINTEKIDIVHARSRVPAWIAFFACRRTEATFLTTCHGYYSQHFFSRVMGWGKLVIAISQVIARHMVQDFHVPSARVRVIARSVDVARFSVPRPDPKSRPYPVIAMIGRITPLKGHPFFLKAMANVLRVFPDAKIMVIGDAPAKKAAYKQELIALTKRLGIDGKVEFCGNRRDIPQILAQTDCLVLSTVTQEAFGRVIIEAQSAGVPVVATSVGGVTEVIDHEKTGLLVIPKDAQSISDAVIRILKNPTLAKSMVEAAKVKIGNQYSLEHMTEATIAVYRELLRSQSILIIKLSAVGDIILSTAAIKAIRDKYPQAQIHCLTSPQGAAVLERCPYLNSVIIFEPHKKRLKDVLKMARHLRTYRFDKVIDLQNNKTSHLLSFWTFPKESYGFNNGKLGFLLSKRLRNDLKDIPPVEHQFRILKMIGVDYDPSLTLELWPTAKEEQYIQALIESEWVGGNQAIVGINIAASAGWRTKNWPIEHIAKLCDLLGAKNIRVVLTGQEKDRGVARAILSKAKAKPASFVGKTNVMQLAALIKRCKAYVSLDSAPLHIAASMNVPVIALFGPTDPKRHMPPTQRAVVLQKTLACAPCYSCTCRVEGHPCMTTITPEEVFKRIMVL